ncbi:hypothetical protein HUJ04_003179 [Dendroctonus ponderosae]|nr:hypothetical protein HUJ04_003179 [Dendroctonus ponderosae]KAH1014326.1 hypothetical protein HUJ04_003179 [Dendroctonus ponderosae]KAH1014327.1 hypothetical protein HUJ04_003179 [Dendroctonus ponderosae]
MFKMIWTTSALFPMLCFLVQSVPIPNNLLVTVPNGAIQGATYSTGNNISYFGFRGIPFATPPIDDLRFEPPQPAQPWTGILDATQDASGCISIFHGDSTVVESEDCLYLNVYVPNVQLAEDFPVMFFIFGGGFREGNSSKLFYGPDFLMERGNVILVTFNYRLGAFGFISTEDEVLPGNAGLKDQNLALQWTYENIIYFGGDPNKITIFGESAGGASTGLHLVSKKSAAYWWNTELALQRQRCIEARRRLTRDKKNNTINTKELSLHANIYKTNKNELKMLIQRSKREHWKSLCEDLDNDIWGKAYQIITKRVNIRKRVIPDDNTPKKAVIN